MIPGPILGPRIVIAGNSGSGKSTLAKLLAQRIVAPTIDLDPIHWHDRVGHERDEKRAADMVVEAAAKPRWIIEGVWGELAAAALPFATALIWLDLPWDVCREGLSRRGPWKAATAEDYQAFLQWAEDHWQRTTTTSFAGHLALFEGFSKTKIRLGQRSEIDQFVSGLHRCSGET